MRAWVRRLFSLGKNPQDAAEHATTWSRRKWNLPKTCPSTYQYYVKYFITTSSCVLWQSGIFSWGEEIFSSTKKMGTHQQRISHNRGHARYVDARENRAFSDLSVPVSLKGRRDIKRTSNHHARARVRSTVFPLLLEIRPSVPIYSSLLFLNSRSFTQQWLVSFRSTDIISNDLSTQRSRLPRYTIYIYGTYYSTNVPRGTKFHAEMRKVSLETWE